MRSTQILSLVGSLTATVSAGLIGFGITTDKCGDGFYVGCTAAAGECCALPSNYHASSVSFSIDTNSGDAFGRAFNKPDCNLADRVADRHSLGQTDFCIPDLSPYDVVSAKFEDSGAAGKKSRNVVGGGSVKRREGEKACRSVDHIVFPGGARADVQGLEEREISEIIDMIVARGDAAAVEAKIAAFRK